MEHGSAFGQHVASAASTRDRSRAPAMMQLFSRKSRRALVEARGDKLKLVSHVGPRKARSSLLDQCGSEKWRAVVPMIPLTLPADWVGPLRERCTATIANIKELEAKGRIAVFGDIESLDDLEPRPEESDTPRSGKELA